MINNAQLSLSVIVKIKDRGRTVDRVGTPVEFKGEIVGKVVHIESSHLLHIEIPIYLVKEIEGYQWQHFGFLLY